MIIMDRNFKQEIKTILEMLLVTLSSAEIVGRKVPGMGCEASERGSVALGQIHDMEVVPHTSAISGGIVIAKHSETFSTANSHL